MVETDLAALEETMARPVLVDGRNVFGLEKMKATGFSYYPIGRNAIRRERYPTRKPN